jgi:hypothetical protein
VRHDSEAESLRRRRVVRRHSGDQEVDGGRIVGGTDGEDEDQTTSEIEPVYGSEVAAHRGKCEDLVAISQRWGETIVQSDVEGTIEECFGRDVEVGISLRPLFDPSPI